VPVEFLSDDQAAAYGHFLGEPTREQLERFFWLNDADLARIGRRRQHATALGYALQLGTVRFGHLPGRPRRGALASGRLRGRTARDR